MTDETEASDSPREECGELVARCFQARTEAHYAHLLTNSYAEHRALNEFYDGVVSLADSFAEAATGRHGMLKYPVPYLRGGDRHKPLTIPTELRKWIDEHRVNCGPQRELQNLIDSLLDLCDSVIYKLRFLS